MTKKLQRNVLHLKFCLNFGNLKFRIPLTFGIKKLQSLEFKNLGQISQIWNWILWISKKFIRISKFRISNFEIYRCIDFEIYRFYNFEILRFIDFEILRFIDSDILRFIDFYIFTFIDFQILRLIDFTILRFLDFEIYRFIDF